MLQKPYKSFLPKSNAGKKALANLFSRFVLTVRPRMCASIHAPILFRELLISAARGQAEVNQDRFLVLSIAIDESSYEHISAMSADQKADEVGITSSKPAAGQLARQQNPNPIASRLGVMRIQQLSKLWESTKKEDKDPRAKDAKRGKKIAVEYEYPEDLQAVAGRLMEAPHPAEGADARDRTTNIDTSSRTLGNETPGTPEAIFAELQATRKKYDAVSSIEKRLAAIRSS